MTHWTRPALPPTAHGPAAGRIVGWADSAGVLGAVFAALCCMGAPIIVGVLGAIGLSWLRRDAILWPLMLLSLAIALGWILLNKRLVERHSPVVVTAYGLLLGTAMLAAWVPLRYGLPPVAHVSMKAWLALAGSGVLCTATTTLLWNWGMTQVPASQAGVLLNMEPLMGSLLGVFVLGEHLGPSAWTGGCMILAAAIILTTRSKAHVLEVQPAG